MFSLLFLSLLANEIQYITYSPLIVSMYSNHSGKCTLALNNKASHNINCNPISIVLHVHVTIQTAAAFSDFVDSKPISLLGFSVFLFPFIDVCNSFRSYCCSIVFVWMWHKKLEISVNFQIVELSNRFACQCAHSVENCIPTLWYLLSFHLSSQSTAQAFARGCWMSVLFDLTHN